MDPYSINRTWESSGNRNNFSYKSKNSANQIMELKILNIYPNEKRFWVSFCVMTKRKHGFLENVSTGKSGISSLLWAKNCLKDFISWAKISGFYTGWEISIFPSNKQRKIVYDYGLKDLGFKSCYDNPKVLILKM